MAHLPPHQLSDVAEGLNYLHSCNVIHRGLKAVRDRSNTHRATVLIPGQSNILVDGSDRARIADFGIAAVIQDRNSVQDVMDEYEYTARWTAPEILNEQDPYSKESDIFSFAMVMIEVCYGLPIVCRCLFHVNVGVHWRGSFQWESTCCGHVGHNGWQTSAAAHPCNLHR